MNGIMVCSSLGAMTLAAVATMTGPPAATDTQPAETATRHFFAARQADAAKPPKGRWELNLQSVGLLNIVVDDHGRRVLLDNKPLPADRVIWQPHNLVMIVDELHQRQFEVALGEKGRIDYIRPGTWLEYRGANPPRVAIGIYTDPVSPSLASQLGLDPDTALLVKSVVENMSAFKSGVHQFDIITAVDDEDQVNQETLQKIVFSKEPGQSIQLRLIRRSQPIELSVNVEAVEPLNSEAVDPLFGGTMGMEDIQIDMNSFRTGNVLGLRYGDPDRPVIQFRDQGDAIVFSRPAFPNVDSIQRPPTTLTVEALSPTAADLQGLEVQIKRLTERIASLESMIARLVGEPPAIAPASTKP